MLKVKICFNVKFKRLLTNARSILYTYQLMSKVKFINMYDIILWLSFHIQI